MKGIWIRARMLLVLMLAMEIVACAPSNERAERETGGDASRGRIALRQYGCQTCHIIPGVTGADALVGPPLAGIADRKTIAGVRANTIENMVAWLVAPQQIAPMSAMPDLGVAEADARDMAAYLYTLR